MKISNYTQLPSKEKLKQTLLSQAALDIIMVEEEDSWLRLTSFYKDYSDGVDMVKIDNGAGDHIYFLFSKDGTVIKGFDHESILSPYANAEEEIAKGIYDLVPRELLRLLDESIERDDVTFCVWRSLNNSLWRKGDVVVPKGYKNNGDGEVFLLGYIFKNADIWLDWAKSYYEEQSENIQVDSVVKIYKRESITSSLIEKINPKRDVECVFKELKEIGYTI
jgi:hypothetical protein